jgi:TFIIF-interacting CTD phosphatase-like protein
MYGLEFYNRIKQLSHFFYRCSNLDSCSFVVKRKSCGHLLTFHTKMHKLALNSPSHVQIYLKPVQSRLIPKHKCNSRPYETKLMYIMSNEHFTFHCVSNVG